jgi:regulatory protein
MADFDLPAGVPSGGAPSGGVPSGGVPLDDPLTAINPADIRLAAMNLLARREHSLKELQQKLRRRFPDGELIEQVLQRLAEDNLQSDQRFAESFVRQRCARGYGPLRLRQEMREKGLSDSLVVTAFDQPELDWYAQAEDVFRKKFGEPCPVELKEKARRARFMQYRGFSGDHYQHLIGD